MNKTYHGAKTAYIASPLIWLYIAYYVPIHINRQIHKMLQLVLIKMKASYLQSQLSHRLTISYTLTSSLWKSILREDSG